jgi:hypothetical protein
VVNNRIHTLHGVREFRPFSSKQFFLRLDLSLATVDSDDLSSNIHSRCNEGASYYEAFVFG